MALDGFKVLYQGQPGTSATTLYTVPANRETAIKGITIVNPTGVAHTIKLWEGGQLDANVILPVTTLGPGESLEGDGTVLMEAAETISGQADAAASITVTIYGLEKA